MPIDLTIPAQDPIKTFPFWRDGLGVVFKPGDLLLYPTASNSNAYLNVGMVKKINRTDSKGQPHMTPDRYRSDYDADRRYIGRTKIADGEPTCTITLRLIGNTGSKTSQYDIDHSKDSTIQRIERVLKTETPLNLWLACFGIEPANIILR